jgi:CheY-like chemotaxis protein
MPKILIVDDEAVNRLVLLAMLEDLGAVVEEAGGGAEALRALSHNVYDVLLLDIHMPETGGIEVAATVRGSPGPNRDVPIVAVTGDTSRTLREYQALGFDGLVEKPISLAAIRLCLETRRPLTLT